MAKINIKDSGKFSQGASEFFTLADDGDVARVRFLYDDPEGGDMDYYLVHEVEIDGRKRYVSCNGIDDEGHYHKDDCPLCQAKVPTKEKLFLQLYDEEAGTIKVWERGKNFVGKIVTFLNRFGSLVSRPIEIERRGKKGDMKTTYELFALDSDKKTLEDFPEKRDLEGTLIVKATKQEMLDILDGTFTLKSEGEQTQAPRQQEAPQEYTRRGRTTTDEEPPRRRSRDRQQTDAF